RIMEEEKLIKNYGLRRKREIWRAQEILRKFRRRARNLIAVKDEAKTKILLDKLVSMGLLQKGQGLDQVLALKINDILERRLQTLVYKKGFASTIKDARQKIVHGHVYVDGRKVVYPSYLVPIDKENLITIKGGNK
ncbi:MAG: 30S ribosomal protein S4, partial [Candidatus Aenigmatarchaeota archaeon]